MIGIKALNQDLRPSSFDGVKLRRVGSKNDGGYVIPVEPTLQTNLLVSLGYGYNHEFEKALINQFSNIKKAYLFDGSASFLFVCRQALGNLILFIFKKKNSLRVSFENLIDYVKLWSNRRLKFYSIYIGNSEGYLQYSEISNFVEFSTDREIFLKIDIEGGEYEILDDILLQSDKIVVLIIEFHNIVKMTDAFNELLFRIKSVFHLLNVNINNNSILSASSYPSVVELTFVNKKTISSKEELQGTSYNDLNSGCDPNLPDFYFVF